MTEQLRPLNRARTTFRIRGISPLLMHKWSEKAKQEIKDKQAKKAQKGREVRNPEAEMEAALYRLGDGYGFPATGVKAAMVRAGKLLGVPMTDLRCMFHINEDLIAIEGTPVLDEQMVRVGTGTDIRYRPRFDQWSGIVPIDYDPEQISEEQLVNLLNRAGFAVGIGDWRPEKDGTNGRFEVVA